VGSPREFPKEKKQDWETPSQDTFIESGGPKRDVQDQYHYSGDGRGAPQGASWICSEFLDWKPTSLTIWCPY